MTNLRKKIYVPNCSRLNSFTCRVDDEKKQIANRKLVIKVYKQMGFYKKKG